MSSTPKVVNPVLTGLEFKILLVATLDVPSDFEIHTIIVTVQGRGTAGKIGIRTCPSADRQATNTKGKKAAGVKNYNLHQPD